MVGSVTGTAAPVGTPALPTEQKRVEPAVAAPGKVATQSGEDLPVEARAVAEEDVARAVRKLNELTRT